MKPPTFHAGEHEVQARAGVAERMAQVGPRVIRDFMPDQHRAFFEQLPWLLAGTVDAAGQPWASVLAAPAGFLQSPDAVTLRVNATPLRGDPLQATLAEGAPIGLLGLEPHTRRRNRMNGTVRNLGPEGFVVEVAQSFGNCPKYIQAREPVFLPAAPAQRPAVHEGPTLDDASRRMIRQADTLFIATAYPLAPGGRADGDPAHGVDVSHRGGDAGFARLDADDTLSVPDFLGNFFFNTLGNIAVHPRAGLLFIDFDTGDLLYVAVTATIVWDGPEVRRVAGAQRLLRCRVTFFRRLEAALPLRWGPAARSPFLDFSPAFSA